MILKCLVFIIATCIFLWLLLFLARENIQWRTAISSFYDRLLNSKKYKKLNDDEKNTEEWKYFKYLDKTLSYLTIKPVHFNVHENNAHARILLVCRGAGLPLEYCYYEFVDIVKRYNVQIIALEYPGFGFRKKNGEKITDNSILQQYPQEVIYMVNHVLNIPWDNIFLVGQCFGAPIAITIASLQKNIKHLYLVKPMPNLQDIAGDLTCNLIAKSIPNIFHIHDTILFNVTCPVTIVQPEKDILCKTRRTSKLISRLTNSPYRDLIIVPNAKHDLTMFDALSHVILLKLHG